MATISYVWTVDSDTPGNPVHKVQWNLSAAGADDVGQAFEGAWLNDKNVQLIGTLGTFLLQGSNDGGTTWATLHNPAGTAINETGGARVEQVLENTLLIRPNASGAATDVTVILVGRYPKV